MAQASNNRTTTAGTTVETAENAAWRERVQHVSWGAIFLGLIIAVAVQILLSLLGIGIGFSIVDPTDPMGGIGVWGTGTALYVVITQIIALFLGGYIAARLAPALTAQSAMFHGASIWALALIATIWLGTTTAGMAISGLGGAVSGIASTTTQAVKAAVPEDISMPNVSFQNLPQPIQETLRENGITPDNLRREVRGAYRDVVSPQEEQRVMQQLQQAVQEILQNPTEAAEQVGETIDNIFGEGGILSEQDLDQMRNSLQRRLNLSDQEVDQITNQIQETAQQARENLKQAVSAATEKAAEAAKALSDQIGFIALWMFIASVLGLIAAVVGGKLGEVHEPRVV